MAYVGLRDISTTDEAGEHMCFKNNSRASAASKWESQTECDKVDFEKIYFH